MRKVCNVKVCCSTDLFVAKKLLQHLAAPTDLRHAYYQTADVRWLAAKKKKKIFNLKIPINLRTRIQQLKPVTRYYCPSLIQLEFTRKIFEIPQKLNFTKIRPLETELFYANR